MTLKDIDISKWCPSECKDCKGSGFNEHSDICDCIVMGAYDWLDHDGTLHLHADQKCISCEVAGEFDDHESGIFSAYCHCLDYESAVLEYCTDPNNPPEHESYYNNEDDRYEDIDLYKVTYNFNIKGES